MHGYITKKSKRQKASNHAGWRPKIGKNAGVKSANSKKSYRFRSTAPSAEGDKYRRLERS
jgi:hypothetical protein